MLIGSDAPIRLFCAPAVDRICRNEFAQEWRGLRRGEVRAQLMERCLGDTVDLWRKVTSPTKTSETWRSTPRMSAPSQGL
jgi:hypothetical protein